MDRRVTALVALAAAVVTGCAARPGPQSWSADASSGPAVANATAPGAALSRATAAGPQRRPGAAGSASLTNIADKPPTDLSNAPGLAYSLGDEDCYLQRGSDGVVRGRVTMAMRGGGVRLRLLEKMVNRILGAEIDIDIRSAEVGGGALLTTGGHGRVTVHGHPMRMPTVKPDGGGPVADDHPLLTTPYHVELAGRVRRPSASISYSRAVPTTDESAASVSGDYPRPELRVGFHAADIAAGQAVGESHRLCHQRVWARPRAHVC